MTTISPTRVSMYDFLYQDIQPLTSLLADTATLSLPQTRIAVNSSVQAILAALLAYQQRYQAQAVNKKLFSRAAVKELRQYNAMNFATLSATLYHRHDVTETLFIDSTRVNQACDYIAGQIDASAAQVKILLGTLTIIVLRELAILTEYSQLDNEELEKWFALQPQFLTKQRFAADSADSSKDMIPTKLKDNELHTTANSQALSCEATDTEIASTEQVNTEALDIRPPAFDPYWYELTKFTPNLHASAQDMQQATSNYLRVIGRSPENIQQGRHNDLLVFTQMPSISVPHQRWLLQLAKISDIYLNRQRLRIASEPIDPPTAPLVSLALIGGNSDNTPTTTSETPIEYEPTAPLWKNPVILIIILVIGALSALATLKYQTQKSSGTITATEAVIEHDQAEEREQQDVAIVKVDDEDAAE
ncbi:hypothetical protein ACS8FD_11715 [Psychrobacter sp. 1U2]|uniref:hypothetical protein n=1 Tax=Psychrobacter sp. 1U2 TaxID=3453577 RepID=UPI003F447A22